MLEIAEHQGRSQCSTRGMEGGGGGGGDLMHAPIQNDIRCCEILLRPFVEQTHFITVGTETYR